jgi:hypothetical protein
MKQAADPAGSCALRKRGAGPKLRWSDPEMNLASFGDRTYINPTSGRGLCGGSCGWTTPAATLAYGVSCSRSGRADLDNAGRLGARAGRLAARRLEPAVQVSGGPIPMLVRMHSCRLSRERTADRPFLGPADPWAAPRTSP